MSGGVVEAIAEKRFDSLYGTYQLLVDKLQTHWDAFSGQREPKPPTPTAAEQPRRGSRGSITTGAGTTLRN